MTIYLAGLISTDFPQSLDWRSNAEQRLRSVGITTLNPLRGVSPNHADSGLTSECSTPKLILARDYQDIQNSDILLVCLDDFGSPRPLIGTIAELAWAWELRLPVIAFGATSLMQRHPFIQEFVSQYCGTLNEALELITHRFV